MNPFDTAGFPARWSCGAAWSDQPWVGWLHILSDIIIFASYYTVPIVVMYFVRQRNDLRFPPIFYGFLAVILLSCGTVHLVEAGMDAYVSKPINRQDLYEAIQSLLPAVQHHSAPATVPNESAEPLWKLAEAMEHKAAENQLAAVTESFPEFKQLVARILEELRTRKAG